MDTIQIQCNRLVNTLKSKYNLDKEQGEALNRAIAKYDYFQNEGVVFTTIRDILECFAPEDSLIAPNEETLHTLCALCEYIIGTIQFYELPGYTIIKSEADIRAKEIMQNKLLYPIGWGAKIHPNREEDIMDKELKEIGLAGEINFAPSDILNTLYEIAMGKEVE